MQPATLANCLKIIDFFPDRNVPDYEECGSFKFHDATLTYYVLYSLLLQIITKQLHFSHIEDILIEKKYNDFWAVGE